MTDGRVDLPRTSVPMALPVGWHWVKLGEVCDIVMGQSPPGASYNEKGDGVPLLNGPTEFGAIYPVATQWTTAPTKSAIHGDILFCVRGATTGKKNMADRGYCIGRGLAAIRAKEGKSCAEFIWYLLDVVTGTLLQKAAGSTFINLPGAALEVFPIPLPPLSEQRRISEVLREQMTAVEKARAAAQARLEAVTAMAAAFLRKAFPLPGQPLPPGWRWAMLGECGEVVSGVTLGRKLNGAVIREVAYLRVANVKDGHLDLDDLATTPATEEEIRTLSLKQGDLLLTEGGDADKLGRGTIWEAQIQECIHQNHIFRVRLESDGLIPDFVALQIASPHGKEYFLRHAKQTTGIATINQRVLKALPLMLPSAPEQQRIAALLRDQMAAVEKARAAVEQEVATINALPPVLLRRAFNGEV